MIESEDPKTNGASASTGEDDLWQALADGSRRAILDALAAGPASTGRIAELLRVERGLSRFAAMKHLGILERAGLVTHRREGKFRYNYLNAAPLVAMYRRWVSRFAVLPASIGSDLKHFVESDTARVAGGEDK